VPEGALSLLVGSPRDLLTHLGAQDVLAFTGSGDTGMKIRALPNVIRHSVRVNVEADSLNAAVLGADAAPRSDMYELFLKDVVRDMTQKAGQKCTAIRRVLVSSQIMNEVKSDLFELLAQIRVGNPADEETRMGPLATKSQLEDAHKGIALLNGKLAYGNLDRQPKGFFLSPILLESPGEAVHEHEVFGPVASLLPYESNAGEVVARGNGGLVCSLYSEDQSFLEETIAAVAPFHGRIFIGHPKIELSPGPGTVLPQLVHGGPGRAGGGEELGGPRGLAFYLQRTALQGPRPAIQKLLG
jgi:oxepin-CoA hydrolase/3-oxo-5,6-dehydrosuberyl-CoA semialdehyde dehydrogenase